MAINALQPILRGATGKELQFTGDFHAYWDQLGIPPGQFAERMAAWKALPQNAAWIDATEDADAAGVVEGLWRNGEQGAWYEASDLATMFQDAAGTLPVYAPGQGQVDPPVGLLLDKRLPIGSELVQNGDNESSVAVVPEDVLVRLSKTRTADFAQSGAFSTKLTPTAGSGAHYWQLWKVPANKSVLVTGFVYVPAGAAAGQPIRIVDQSDGSVIVDVAPAASTDRWVSFRYYRAPKGAPWILSLGNNTPADWGTTSIYVDNLSIRELPGNHAYQTTTTSRPTLSARYNLLTNTSFAGATAGAPGTAPTGWVFGFTTGEITAVTPLGPDFAIQIATSATRLIFTQQLTAAPNVAYSHWIDVLETTGISAVNFIALTAPPSGATTTYWFNGELITSSTVISSPGRLEMRMTVGGTGGSYYVRFGVGCSGNTTGVATIARPDVRVTNDGVGLPPYQRVVDPNTYDTAGFPLYLKFDGVDDWLQTASIDFSASARVAIAATVRKLSDAATGATVELSPVANSNNGAFALFAPLSTSTPGIGLRYSGATPFQDVNAPLVGQASTVVLATIGLDGSGAKMSVNGALYSNPSVAGGGAFGNYALYIGRRGGSLFPFNGRLFALQLRGGGATDSQLAAMGRYLNSKGRIY